jgi:hypothetical protein
LDTVISACLGECPEGQPLTSIPLKPVLSVGAKLRAAQARRLDSVLLAGDEENTAEEQEIDRERDQAANRSRRHAGLHVERLATMGDALDRMLETGRTLRSWQEEVQQRWLALWEPGTATEEAMGLRPSTSDHPPK